MLEEMDTREYHQHGVHIVENIDSCREVDKRVSNEGMNHVR